MKIRWKDEAKASMLQIAKYINIKFGKKSRLKFIQRVQDMEKSIKNNPFFPKVDPLFDGYGKEFRSVFINGLSRMVYYVDGDIIRIVAFFDGRRDAENQANQITE